MIFNMAVGGEDDDGNAAGKRDNPHTVRPEDVEDIPPPDHPDRIPPGDPDIKPLPKKNASEDFGKMQKEIHAIRGEVELKNWGRASANRIATFPIDWQEIMREYMPPILLRCAPSRPPKKHSRKARGWSICRMPTKIARTWRNSSRWIRTCRSRGLNTYRRRPSISRTKSVSALQRNEQAEK